jgi:predicted O-methyltransferase YrrM
MVVGDKAACSWPYLRRQIPHCWYVDRRAPGVGFLNRDEAHVLYNTALRFRGQPALEIGCWLGWSACHLALAGVQLDVIDPILERHDFCASVAASLDAAGVRQAVNLIGGCSPQKVHELAAQRKGKWSLFFIDGNHDAPYPLQDAMACEVCAAPDALMLFHDLVSPDVAQALDYLQDHGWDTTVYQTMQVMGAAWRGNVKPVEHIPDPTVAWPVPDHLRRHLMTKGNGLP